MLNIFKNDPKKVVSEIEKTLFVNYLGFIEGVNIMKSSVEGLLVEKDANIFDLLKASGYQGQTDTLEEMFNSFERFHNFFETELTRMEPIIKKIPGQKKKKSKFRR